MTIDVDGGLDVRALQEQRDALALPVFRYIDVLPVPCGSHVVLRGRKEERELDVVRLTISLHVRIEVEAGVVERTRPGCGKRYGIALVVGQHRAGQRDKVVVFFAKG